MISSGKLKKDKPLPAITEDEIPFEIPDNWCFTRLIDICDINTGNSIPKDICTVNCRESHSDNELAEKTGRAGGNEQADTGTMTGAARIGLNTWLHAEIYRKCFSVNAVITAQPPYLMAFAVTGREIDVRTIPESWLLLKELPFLSADALAPDREDIFEKLRSGSPAVLLGHSLVIVTGDNLLQAFDRLEVAEMTAMSLALAMQSGEVKSIPEAQIEALKSTFLK